MADVRLWITHKLLQFKVGIITLRQLILYTYRCRTHISCIPSTGANTSLWCTNNHKIVC